MRLGFHYTLIRGFVFLAETLECIILFHFLFLKWGRRWIVLLLNSAVTFLLIDNYFGSVWRYWAAAPWCRLYHFSCSPENWDSIIMLFQFFSVLFDWLWRRFWRELFFCITTKWFKISHPLCFYEHFSTNWRIF